MKTWDRCSESYYQNVRLAAVLPAAQTGEKAVAFMRGNIKTANRLYNIRSAQITLVSENGHHIHQLYRRNQAITLADT